MRDCSIETNENCQYEENEFEGNNDQYDSKEATSEESKKQREEIEQKEFMDDQNEVDRKCTLTVEPSSTCLQIDDILLTADHVLNSTTPHQVPESITLNTGLGHYLSSLDKISRLDPFRIGLGGHEEPIEDIRQRITDIKNFHEMRLDKVRKICQGEPKNVQEISKHLFGPREGYHVWLALEEAGAHVEYLYLRGEIIATNVDVIEQQAHPVIEHQSV